MLISAFSTAGNGVKKAIPNMIYGNSLFIVILILRAVLSNPQVTSGDLDYYLYALVAVSILFFLGLFITILPSIIGGSLLSIWLTRDKHQVSTSTGIFRGAIIGFLGMAAVCALIYPFYRPHGLPDPSFPLNASIAIMIAAITGAITGLQLVRDLLKTSE